MLGSLFAGAETSDWSFFWLALVVDVLVLATLLPLTIELWRRLWTRRLRARILHTALHSYLASAATLKINTGNLSASVLRERIIEATQASRRRFADVMPALMPVLDPDSQEVLTEANSAFTDVLNFIEMCAWKAQPGLPPPEGTVALLSVEREFRLREALQKLRARASRLNSGKGLTEAFDESVMDNIFASGIAIEVLWKRIEAADARRRRKREEMFADV